jgi:glycosyltransferase involved in cell wall biosynthesis
MKVLHVTPHLGGGVGKAHASIAGALSGEIEQTFVLLEQPRERRYIEIIEGHGARMVVATGLDHVAELARAADIVQFEFWNHPRLFECLARCDFPAMRSVFWSHISGLSRPLIPAGLIRQAGRFVFTTPASLPVADPADRKNIAVINSGFGFPSAPPRTTSKIPKIAYLGTVDFVKMHPGFFDAIDRLSGDDIRVAVWGTVNPFVAARKLSMQHPERIDFRGPTADPAAALSEADIFFYPLQRDHYGTAENALVEAMSLGLVPVVLNNPAELAIVRDGETGYVADSIEYCSALLQVLLSSPDAQVRVSQNAAQHIAQTRTPDIAARDFMNLWGGLLDEAPRQADFRNIVGDNPAAWFAATQGQNPPSEPADGQSPDVAAKGTLAHFESVFAGDESLSRLRRQRQTA